MRERLARRIALATGLLVLLAAGGFAWLRNRGALLWVAPPPAPLSAIAARGRAVYERELCAACHSISGEGNLRIPLDGVGSRLSAEEMRKWIAPPPEMREKFPERVFEAKQQFRELPPEDLEALTQFLETLEAPPTKE